MVSKIFENFRYIIGGCFSFFFYRYDRFVGGRDDWIRYFFLSFFYLVNGYFSI